MLGWLPHKEVRPVLKKSVFILLLAHGVAATAQTISGHVFCAGTSFDPSPASVSISGKVAAADVGLPGAIWVGIEDPQCTRHTCSIFDTQRLGGLDDGWLSNLRGDTGHRVNIFVFSVHPGVTHLGRLRRDQCQLGRVEGLRGLWRLNA
jgi:hypothetical protein